MNTLDSTSAVLAYHTDTQIDSGVAHRLMVLIPAGSNYIAATHRIWELAHANGAHILFIGLYSDPTQEPGLRRELVTMAAIMSNGNVSATVEIIPGRDWVGAVRARRQAGDTVVCFEEQHRTMSHTPLSQIMGSDLDMPLHILSGVYPENDSSPTLLAQSATWIGSIAILLGFFAFHVKIGEVANAPVRTGLLLVSIPFEFWLIWAWNSLFG